MVAKPHGCSGSQEPESFTKGKSLEELVCSPAYDGELAEFKRHTSLSLNMVLLPLFEAGWNPKQFGKHRLEEAAVMWLKGLHSLPAAEA